MLDAGISTSSQVKLIFSVSISDLVTYISGATMLGGLIYIGRKLQILDDLKITTDKIKTNVKVMSDFLSRNNKRFDQTELQAYSPLRLTPKGESLIKTTGFDNIFTKNKDDFFKCIDNEKPKLKYDVEAASIKSIFVLSDKDYMNFLKVFFYNNPNRNLSDTAPTLGIYVRDMYLREHPEITQ